MVVGLSFDANDDVHLVCQELFVHYQLYSFFFNDHHQEKTTKKTSHLSAASSSSCKEQSRLLEDHSAEEAALFSIRFLCKALVCLQLLLYELFHV